jgi:hypothetical protein
MSGKKDTTKPCHDAIAAKPEAALFGAQLTGEQEQNIVI